MACHVVMAVRPPEEGKSRLIGTIDDEQRIALNTHMLRHVYDAVRAVFPAASITVVSRSGGLLEAVAAGGARPLAERGHTLNDALLQGAQHAAGRGATEILSMSSDLPFLTPGDIRAMLDAPGDVVIATDQARHGTNALLLRPPFAIPYRYGADSLAAHRAEAAAAGLTATVIERAGLARDIDTPADLSGLRISAPHFLRYGAIAT